MSYLNHQHHYFDDVTCLVWHAYIFAVADVC